jgi:predicted ATPase
MTNPNESAAIRTPDQRLRVFVSSTLTELAEERVSVARAVSALGLIPVMFELGARPQPPQELYRAYLAQSDIFIGLYWQQYGWIGPDMEISGLEDEYRLSQSMPRLLYVKTPAPEREARLTTMIGMLEAQGKVSYRIFRSTRELGRLVRNDLAVLLSERFAAGDSGADRSPSLEASSGRRVLRTLPVASTSLIGREHDIAEVSRLLETDGVRLVTLTGPGGIGKTRLAVAVGAHLEESYPQGVAFVPLASIARPELVLPHIAAALGASIEGTRSPADVVAERIAETPTLLVLDNLEQVIGVGPELDQLLARCVELKMLTTSRTVLRLRAEHEYPVGPLTVPTLMGRPPMEDLASLPAIQLFVDRARAVRHDFALTEDKVLAVTEICRRLDGLPLAIEIAAARIRLLTPDALLARLDVSLQALGTGPADLPERQRTLRATVEWSIGLLDEAERQMLATLSIFVEGWTVEAAEHVSNVPEQRTLDLLDALAGHSLVGIDMTGGGPRFRMLLSIQELAAERLAAGADRADVERRHAEYFRVLVENVDWPTERQAEWAERLRIEQGNMGIAIRWYFTHDIAPLPHMFRILWLFWQMCDRMPEGRAWIRELEMRADELDERAQVELLFLSAVTAGEVGDDDGALAAFEGLGRLDGRIADPYLESAARLAASWIRPIVDDFDGALEAAQAALDGLHRQNEPFTAWAVLTVGLLELRLGRYEAAHTHLSETRELGGRFGNSWLASVARAQLASLAVRTGHLDEAQALLVESMIASHDTSISIQSLTFCLIAFAELALTVGDFRQAALAIGATDGLRQRAGLRAWPLTRRGEAELAARMAEQLGPEDFQKVFAAGSRFSRSDAVALVRANQETLRIDRNREL